MKARQCYEKYVLLFVISIMWIILVIGGCDMKKTDLDVFNENIQLFELVADYLNNEKCCSEITMERPPLFSNVEYQKKGKLFYIDMKNIPDSDTCYIEYIKTLFDKCSLVRIIVPRNESIVVFQMTARLGEGKYIIYTKYGDEYSDEYIHVKEWISENWYVADS